MGVNYDMREVESGPEWLLNKISVESTENAVKIATVLWGIWFVRNKKVWENKSITPEVMIDPSRKQVTEWQEAMGKKQRSMAHEPTGEKVNKMKWEAPDTGWKKLNVDALVFTRFLLSRLVW